jgi:hypothetical protein
VSPKPYRVPPLAPVQFLIVLFFLFLFSSFLSSLGVSAASSSSPITVLSIFGKSKRLDGAEKAKLWQEIAKKDVFNPRPPKAERKPEQEENAGKYGNRKKKKQKAKNQGRGN